jgi:polysaccharide export outer membrane protein
VETPLTAEQPAPVKVQVEAAPVIEAEDASGRARAPQVQAVAPPADEPLAETVPVDAHVDPARQAPGSVGLTDWSPVDPSFFEAPTGAYKIGAGDVLEFQAFSDPLLNREVTVRFDGHISLPLIEDIQVDGLTREEAEERIRMAYTSVFKNPQMSLLVRQTASKTFAVIGDIELPAIYPYLRPLTLIEAISQAGGLRRRNSSSSTGGFVGVTGQLTKAFIVRHRNGERMVVQFDLRELGNPGAHAADAPIYYGDLIYVPEGVNLVYLLGESANPVIVELTENMTLLQMLSLSGGFNASTARLRNVIVMRQLDSENTRIMNVNVREILRTGRDIRLMPGDVIYIPQKWAVRLSEFVQRYTGSVSPVIDLYNSAVQAYYARDLAQRQLANPGVSRTLQRLTEIEQFGTSTGNIVDLFGAP